jgi:hypothetical protein
MENDSEDMLLLYNVRWEVVMAWKGVAPTVVLANGKHIKGVR